MSLDAKNLNVYFKREVTIFLERILDYNHEVKIHLFWELHIKNYFFFFFRICAALYYYMTNSSLDDPNRTNYNNNHTVLQEIVTSEVARQSL